MEGGRVVRYAVVLFGIASHPVPNLAAGATLAFVLKGCSSYNFFHSNLQRTKAIDKRVEMTEEHAEAMEELIEAVKKLKAVIGTSPESPRSFTPNSKMIWDNTMKTLN